MSGDSADKAMPPLFPWPWAWIGLALAARASHGGGRFVRYGKPF